MPDKLLNLADDLKKQAKSGLVELDETVLGRSLLNQVRNALRLELPVQVVHPVVVPNLGIYNYLPRHLKGPVGNIPKSSHQLTNRLYYLLEEQGHSVRIRRSRSKKGMTSILVIDRYHKVPLKQAVVDFAEYLQEQEARSAVFRLHTSGSTFTRRLKFSRSPHLVGLRGDLVAGDDRLGLILLAKQWGRRLERLVDVTLPMNLLDMRRIYFPELADLQLDQAHWLFYDMLEGPLLKRLKLPPDRNDLVRGRLRLGQNLTAAATYPQNRRPSLKGSLARSPRDSRPIFRFQSSTFRLTFGDCKIQDAQLVLESRPNDGGFAAGESLETQGTLKGLLRVGDQSIPVWTQLARDTGALSWSTVPTFRSQGFPLASLAPLTGGGAGWWIVERHVRYIVNHLQNLALTSLTAGVDLPSGTLTDVTVQVEGSRLNLAQDPPFRLIVRDVILQWLVPRTTGAGPTQWLGRATLDLGGPVAIPVYFVPGGFLIQGAAGQYPDLDPTAENDPATDYLTWNQLLQTELFQSLGQAGRVPQEAVQANFTDFVVTFDPNRRRIEVVARIDTVPRARWWVDWSGQQVASGGGVIQ